jgi:filamentous hemagglutinin family protein
MRSTALQAAALVVLASPAAAQIAVNARPAGGQVSAGHASISDTASKTLINQTSQNAAINWQSYNVGSGQTVQYVQPNAASMTLNRVVGPDPSQIAGHILANGQIVLVNQSGVVFAKGAQVDTAGLVVSTAGITDKNFMGGHLVFDQAGHAGAIVSNAGNITVRQAGLAALVAPQVANSGTITARLGRVILGGAETHTLDLYGDGLVALNVTGQVRQASLGGKAVTALVTNSGTILAPGGTVVLSAAAVDGVVTNLVEAGGKIAAPSAGARTGRVLVQGIGGGISIDGDVAATGVTSGTKGGQVVANATGAVRVGAGGVVDASGDAGGGIIAIGTTAARAIGGASVAPTLVAESVSLAAGSRLSANAKHRGAGGRVAVLSRNATTQSGDVSARGGPAGGDGGWIEISGANVDFGGLLATGAAHGAAGTLLIDPENLEIGGASAQAAASGTSYISAGQFTAFHGNVILKADGTLTVTNSITTGLATSLQLEGDEKIVIDASIVAKDFDLTPATGIPVALYSPGLPAGYGGVSGAPAVIGSIVEAAGVGITGASISAQSNGPINLGGTNRLTSVGTFNNTGRASIIDGFTVSTSTGTLFSGSPGTGDEISLTGIAANGTGAITLDNAASMAIQAPVLASIGDVTIGVAGTTGAAPNTLSVQSGITGNDVTISVTGSVSGYAGTAFTEAAGNTIAALGSGTATGGLLSIGVTSGSMSIGGELLTTAPSDGPGPIAGTVTVVAGAGDITEISGGRILTDTLSGAAGGTGNQGTPPAGNADFLVAGNTITTLTGTTTLAIPGVTTLPGFAASGTFALEDNVGLTVKNLAAGSTVLIQGSQPNGDGLGGVSGILQIAGTITASGNITLNNALGIAELGGTPAAAIYSINGSVGLGTAGAIAQAAGATLTGGEASTVGAGVSLAASGSTTFSNFPGATSFGTVSGILLGGTVTAGTLPSHPVATSAYSGWATLVTTGGVDLQEAAGASIRTGTLSGSIAGNVVSTPSNGNAISSIGTSASDSFSAAGSLLLENNVALTVVGTLSAGSTLAVFGPSVATASAGLLTIDGPVTATSITLSNAPGISLDGTVTAGSFVTTASGGTYTGNLTLDASAGGITEGSNGSLRAGTLSGSATAAVSANGSAALSGGTGNTITTLTGFAVSGNLTLDDGTPLTVGSVTAGSASATAANGTLYSGSVTLSSTGDIDESAGTLRAGTVVAQAAGALKLDPASGNVIGTLSGYAHGGDVLVEDDTGLAIGSPSTTLSASGSLSVLQPGGGVTQDGVLIVAGGVSATGSIVLTNALGIGLLATGSVTSTNSSISLTTPGAISQAAGSTIAADTVPGSGAGAGTGTLLTLTAGAAGTITNFGTYGYGTLGTAVQGVAFSGALTAGTLANNQYSGLVSITATTGDITEGATGSLGSGTLAGGAAGGNANFLSDDGNVVGTLNHFSVGGNFALEDNSGLLVLGQAATSGSIDIHGPVPANPALPLTGILVLDGNITASGNINLSNALGVVLLAGSGATPNSVSSTSGGVTLASSGGAVFEQASATITSGATGGLSVAAIELSAGGSTAFDAAITAVDPSLTTAIGTKQGVEFDGVVAAGSAGAYGSALLVATSGDILEDPNTGSLAVGSLTFVATAPGNVTLDPSSGNTIGSIGGSGSILTSSADGNVVIEDDTGLTINALTAGGSIDIHDGAAGASGILVIGGVVSAGGSITLVNAMGIEELAAGSVTSTHAAVSLASLDGAILQQRGASLAGGTGSGTGTLLALSAGGTTAFSTTDTLHGISFAGTLSAGQASFTQATGTLYSGTIALNTVNATTPSSIGTITEDGTAGSTASLRAATLGRDVSGTGTDAIDALFSQSAGNTVTTLDHFAVSRNFELEDDSGLHVLGQTSATGTIWIHGPSTTATPTGLLVIDGVVSAPGAVTLDNGLGIAELAGAAISSTGNAAAVTLHSAGGAIAQRDTASVSVGHLRSLTLIAGGATDFATLLPSSHLPSVSGLSFLGTIAAGTLFGSATGSATLAPSAGSGNTLTAIGSFSSTGATALEDDIGLTIGTLVTIGPVGAGGTPSVGGPVDVHGPTDGHPQSGTLTLTGIVTGASVTLSNENGISLGGTLTAGNLSGSVYTGTATLVANNATAPSLTDSIVQTGGSVRAGILTGKADGAAEFGIAGGVVNALVSNVVSTLSAFSAGGDLTLEDNIAPVIDGVSAGGSIDVETPPSTGGSGGGGGAPAGILQIAGRSSAGNGIFYSNAAGILEDAGASLTSTGHGVTLTASNGAIAQLQGGTLSGAAGLTLVAGGGTDFNAFLQLPLTLDVNGISFAGKLIAGTPSVSAGATLYSATASLAAANGNIIEQPDTGALLAGTLSAAAHTGTLTGAGSIALASTSSAGTGNQLGAISSATAEAGFSLVDGQTLSVTGLVDVITAADVSKTGLHIVAPAIEVTTGSLELQANGGTLGVVGLVADHFAFDPSNAVSTPGGVVALDLLNANGAPSVFSVGPGTDTVLGAGLAHIQSHLGTLAIGSLDGTTVSLGNTVSGSWSLGAQGTVTGIRFTDAVNLRGSLAPAALGLFSDDVIDVSNGVSVASLYGSAGSGLATTGTASFTGSNDIGTLGVVNDAGTLIGFSTARTSTSIIASTAPQFLLDNAAPLVVGQVFAGQGAVDIAVTGATNGAPNALTIGGAIVSGAHTQIGGAVSGTDIGLLASGGITQLTGALNAFGAASGTNGTIAIRSTGGGVSLQSLVTGGSFTSTGFTQNAHSALLIEADGGTIDELSADAHAAGTLSAGTLAALASGDILLGGAFNAFGTVGPLGSTFAGSTLSGLTASGATGIILRNNANLQIADDMVSGGAPPATVSAIGTSSAGTGTGAVSISVTAPGSTLALGSATGATVEAVGAITLTAPGDIVQTGGAVDSHGAGVGITSIGGAIAQIGGAVIAGGGDAQIMAPLGFSQTRARIDAARDARVTVSAGDFTQSSSTILGTHGVVLDIFGAIASTGLGTIASAGIAGDATSGTVVLASATGGISFDGVIAGGSVPNLVYTPAAASAVLLSAGHGDITEAPSGQVDAGTLAATANGNISLAGGPNVIANIGALASAAPALNLPGLRAGGSAGITLADASSLNILADFAGPVVQATSAGATISIAETGVVSDHVQTLYGSLTLGGALASTVLADGDITLQSTGTIAQDAGSIRSASGAVSLASSNGDVTQSGGAFVQAATDIAVTATGNVTQTNAALIAGGNAAVTAGGNVSQSALSEVSATGAVAVTAGGGITVDASLMQANGNLVAHAATGDIDETGGSRIEAAGDVGLYGTLGGLNQSQSIILGTHGVGVNFGGAVTSTQSTIQSAGIAGDPSSGTIAISSGGSMVLASSVLAGASGAVLLSAGGDLSQVSADGSFTGVIVAPALAAAAGGGITLPGANQVGAISAFAPLAGLSAGTGGIAVVDSVNLTFSPGAAITAPSGTILVEATGTAAPSLSSNGAIVHAGGDVTLRADGALAQTGGVFQSDQGGVTLAAQGFTQSGGASVLASGTAQIDAGGGTLTQAAGSVISAGQTISLQSAGDVSLSGTLQAGAPANGIYSGATAIATGGNLLEDRGTVLTGTLAAIAGGVIDLAGTNNQIAQIGSVGTLSGLQGVNITLQDAQSLVVAANVEANVGVAFILDTVSFTEAPGVAVVAANGPLSITAGGTILVGGSLTGASAELASAGALTEQAGGTITAGSATLEAGTALTLDGALSTTGDDVLRAGTDLLVGAGGVIQTTSSAASTALTLTGAGTVTIDGRIQAAAPLTVTGGTVAEDGTGVVTAGATSISATSGVASLAGVLTASGTLGVSAFGDVIVAQTGKVASGPAAISAGGAATIDGALSASGPFSLLAGTDVTEGATGAIAGAGVTIAASAGSVSIGGSVQSSGGFAIAAGTDVTELAGAAISGDAAAAGLREAALAPLINQATGGTITAVGNATIDGTLKDPLSLTLSAGNAFTLGGTGAITGGVVSIAATAGTMTIDGPLVATGALTLRAGTDLLANATITGGASTLSAGGNIAVAGALNASGALGITAGSFVESASGVVSGGPITLAAPNGAVTIDGSFTSGAAVTIGAGTDFAEGAGAVLAGAPLSVTAKAGAASIGGAFTSFGAFTIDAGTDITQGDASTISDTRLGAATLSSLLAAPGTITLGGTLSASSLLVGDLVTKPSDPVTKAVIWNGNAVQTGSNATIHGATNSIAIAAPLKPGNGALGVYVDTASFQQTGSSSVAAIPGTGPSATMQVTVEGRGTAKFNSLAAPTAQLLLVLEHGGTAGGLIDVAGLNIYYTTGIIPVAPVTLQGIVGGRSGFAAAAVGFSHHLPDVNYQINACPIESINCILLSPLLVPVVDPVNDYAEGTQRKRHQDDDALPNVGEEDY